MIDLSQFVDKDVTVELRNGDVHEGRVELSAVHGFPFLLTHSGELYPKLYKQNGHWAGVHHSQDIIYIQELYVDLSQFVDKDVTVKFRHGGIAEGNIRFNNDYAFPYKFEAVDGEIFSYTGAGRYFVTREDRRDIVAIEEIKPAVAENGVPTLSKLEVRKTQLEAELEEVKKQIRVANGPDGFSASEVFNFLQTGERESVSLMFSWNSTPQGYDHWQALLAGDKKLSREDVEYLVNCLSKHFLRKFE